MIRMRPGVPWNVKGIEAEARDMAQLAARRAGVSLGEWLTQVIMTEGRGGAQPHYMPGDGTYGPAPQPQYQPPLPSLRYPQPFPQAQPQSYAQPQNYQQPYPQAPQHQQHSYPPHLQPVPQPGQPQPYPRDALSGAAQVLDSQIRGSEFAVVAHGLRDLADRLDNSERRAQHAIASVNQSVAAMQDRIDAAERVKQLADVAFTSAADALATSARDQSVAFESLETTVRSVQKRINEIEAGRTDLPGKDAMARLESALNQLQKRLGEMEAARNDFPHKDVLGRMENVVGQLQRRLSEIEAQRNEFPAKEAMARLEAQIADIKSTRNDSPYKEALARLEAQIADMKSTRTDKDAMSRLETQIGDVRHDIADSEKRSREDLTQLATFMRELGTRVDNAERNSAQGGGKALVDGVSARLDALEARSSSLFGELRDSLSAMDGRMAQAFASSKGGKSLFDGVSARIDALEARSSTMFDEVRDSLSAMDGRIAQMSATSHGAGKSVLDGVGARLDALEMRSAALFDEMRGSLAAMDGRIAQITTSAKSGVSAEAVSALKRSVDQLGQRFDTIDERIEAFAERVETVGDASQGPLSGPIGAIESTLEALTGKIEEGEKRAADSVSTVSNALKTISTRIEESDKRQGQGLQTITRRLDDADRKAAESAHAVEDGLRALTQRLETSDKKHKEAIGGLRLTVDGLVAKAAAEALPIDSMLARATSAPSHLSGAALPFTPLPPNFNVPLLAERSEPEFPPFAAPSSEAHSSHAPEPRAFEDEAPPKPAHDGYSVSALETILASTLSPPPPSSDLPNFDEGKFVPEGELEARDEFEAAPPRKEDFLTQARRAAQAAAQAEAERAPQKRPGYAPYGQTEPGGRNIGRLMMVSLFCIVLVAGIVALLFTMPGGDDESTNRPAASDSLGEIINGTPAPAQPNADATSPSPAAAFAPPTNEAGVPVAPANVSAEANGLGVPTSEASPPAFTAGTSPLPGGNVTNTDTTIAALEAGAVRGDARSQFVLALRYTEGRGVERDDAKAVSLVTKAAQQGLVVAEYRLGAIYERGIGVQKDLAQARIWYERAAKGGNRKAMHNLAVLYADGIGIGQNFQEAARWFKQGADYGLADSQYNLAILLERGMGVEKNLSEAARWYAIASAQGDVGAAERLDGLKKTMSAGDIALALEAARTFKAKALDPVANEVPTVNG